MDTAINIDMCAMLFSNLVTTDDVPYVILYSIVRMTMVGTQWLMPVFTTFLGGRGASSNFVQKTNFLAVHVFSSKFWVEKQIVMLL